MKPSSLQTFFYIWNFLRNVRVIRKFTSVDNVSLHAQSFLIKRKHTRNYFIVLVSQQQICTWPHGCTNKFKVVGLDLFGICKLITGPADEQMTLQDFVKH
jgi:hypothetical protein